MNGSRGSMRNVPGDDGVRVDLWVRERARVVAQYRQARNVVGAAFVAGLLVAAVMVFVPPARIEGWTLPWVPLLIVLGAALLVGVLLVRRWAVVRSGVDDPGR